MELEELRALIQQVVVARRLAKEAQDTLSILRQKWETDNRHFIDDAKRLQEELAGEEVLLREGALTIYSSTGEKQVAPGVAIRVNRKVIYDTKAAVRWSQEHGGIAHVFDAKGFEKLALAGQAADIVQIEDAPIATLAKDLE